LQERLDLIVQTMRDIRGHRTVVGMTVLAGGASLFIGNAYQAQMPGYAADLAVFDADGFLSPASTFDPNRLATGMRHVVVNGAPTLRDGALTGRRAGQVLRRGGA
jgi:hypothetical protein